MLTLTDAAVDKVREIVEAQDQQGAGLRVYVAGGGCSGLKYGMALDKERHEDDIIVEFGGLEVIVDSMSSPFVKGASVDYVEDSLLGSGFKVDNPNAETTCGCGSSFSPGGYGGGGGGGGGGGCGGGGGMR